MREWINRVTIHLVCPRRERWCSHAEAGRRQCTNDLPGKEKKSKGMRKRSERERMREREREDEREKRQEREREREKRRKN